MTDNKEFIKKKYEKKVIYPYFLECAGYTMDEYWIQMFENMSKGKFPKNIHYSKYNNIIQIKIGNDKDVYRITENVSYDFQSIKELFQKKLHLQSNKDKDDIKTNMEKIRNEISSSYDVDWKNLKKKTVKDAIIRAYIISLEDEYKLNKDELKQLIQTIQLGSSFGWINDNTIIYQDKSIVDISNLHFDHEKRKFYIKKPHHIIKRTIEIKTNKLIDKWDKMIECPKNRYKYFKEVDD